MAYYKDKVQAAERAKKDRRRRGKGRRVAIVLASLAVLMVLIAVGAWGFLRYTNNLRAGMFADRSSSQMQKIRWQRDEAEALEPKKEDAPDWIDEDGNEYRYRSDVQTLLIMGIDYMDDPEFWDSDMVSNGGNADIMALVILDGKSDRMSILYIPRDTMTDILMLDAQGNYLDTVFNNISASHSYGDGGALSCELSADAVSNMLYGVPITRFAAMDFESIPVINQALGGLEITFPDDYSNLDASFQKGNTVRLTDRQLERLIRFRDHREVDSATQRGLRDLKLVLRAMLNQLKRLAKEDPGAVMTVYNKLKPHLTSNLSLDEVSYLAQNISGFSIDGDTIISMPGVVTKGEEYAEFYPDEDWLHDFVAETFCEKLN
ncbi:MAG: LCP family protein [Clostridia bacterium]